ncbi:MAG TPA: hypothetical protein VFM65_02400 [Flavobacteriaceae bacterium]|nr:hypothetical protein [Flavobacteriaceae bacterium]
MLIKFGAIILCFFAEIALGIYMYLHFESLFARFVFFVFTAILAAMIVIKLAGPVVNEDNEDAYTKNLPEEEKTSSVEKKS